MPFQQVASILLMMYSADQTELNEFDLSIAIPSHFDSAGMMY
jgi:hypothetical protein